MDSPELQENLPEVQGYNPQGFQSLREMSCNLEGNTELEVQGYNLMRVPEPANGTGL